MPAAAQAKLIATRQGEGILQGGAASKSTSTALGVVMKFGQRV
jgi:hypothetical protein